MQRRTWIAGLFCAGAALAAHGAEIGNAALVRQVGDAERGFAATMAKRDFAGFVDYLSEEAVFRGGRGPLVGKQAIATRWKEFFKEPAAPFSWEPDTVIVLASGNLAQTSGPVHDAAGQVIGRFNSVWRKDPAGKWQIVFDAGEQVCACAKAR
jgi:ketosteroid isomerase-like protein